LFKNILKYAQHYNYLQAILKEREYLQKLLKMPTCETWLERAIGLIEEGGWAQALKVICWVARGK
jgi:hypothetical protein